MPTDLCLARWTLNLIQSSELPAIACEWLEAGKDSFALRQLAGLRDPIMSDAQPLWEKALRELRLDSPGRQQALRILAASYASAILAGTLTPYQGARLCRRTSLTT